MHDIGNVVNRSTSCGIWCGYWLTEILKETDMSHEGQDNGCVCDCDIMMSRPEGRRILVSAALIIADKTDVSAVTG